MSSARSHARTKPTESATRRGVFTDQRALKGRATRAEFSPQEPLLASRIVAPRRAAIGSLPLPRRLQGLTGAHESARAGDGGDFRDIHPFTAGDRLRRIDWKATARRGQNAADLYVRRTAALAGTIDVL